MRPDRRLLPALCATALVAGPLHGQARISVPRVTRPPTLEDFLEGRPREAEVVVEGLRQYQPKAGAPVTSPTTAYLSYDDRHLYAAFVVKDDPARIRAHIARRDSMLLEDRVSIGLDTFHDQHRNYWFDVNPYGCQMDGMTIDGEDDFNWDAVYDSRGRFTADGYVVLISVPFKSIRFPRGPKQAWGVVLVRLVTRNNEMSCWPYVNPDVSGWSTQFATLEGLEGISQGSNVQLTPYGMMAGQRYLDQPAGAAPAFRNAREGRAGLDAKVILGDAYALDATVRPDFSQVEADQPQVTVNQRFEVVYPEKRPFFLEGANYFRTLSNLFFSRRIVDPRAGAKLTGKEGPWAVAALAADDMAPGELPPDQASADTGPVSVPGHRAGVGVLRVLREFGPEDRLGLLVTDRNLGPGYNWLAAVDGRFRLWGNFVLDAQWMGSETRRVDGSSFAGPALAGRLLWYDASLFASTLYEDRSAGFHTDLGYLDRVAIRRATQILSYHWHPASALVLAYGPTLNASATWDRQGLLQNQDLAPGFELELANQTHVRLERWESFERYLDLPFNPHRSILTASSEPFHWLGLAASCTLGTGINYQPPAGAAPRLGDLRTFSAGLTLRPDARLSVENSLIYSQLRTPAGAAVYTDRILRSKWNYQFTREFSLRAIFDCNLLVPDPALIAPEVVKDKRFGADLLFTYLLHPGTALYLGWADLCQNLAFDPGLNPALRRTDGIGLATGRLVYLKASWRFDI